MKQYGQISTLVNSLISSDQVPKCWVITAEMGYGHQRAVYPLKDIAEEKIITFYLINPLCELKID